MAVDPAARASSTAPVTVRLGRQLALCAAMCALATVVLAVRGSWTDLLAGPALHWQVASGWAWAPAARFPLGSGLRFRLHRNAAAQHTIESYARLDLSGWNPLWISLAAGVGEELLFRGALQPWLGLWATSALFALAHIRAYRLRQLDRRVLVQALGLLAASLALGLIAKYAGLLSAILAHVAVDVAGLLTIRAVARAQP